jgi:predicted aspartyl protease
MRAILTVFVLALSLSAAQADCGLQKMAGFDMHGLDNGRIEVPVDIDGASYLVLLDTGAPIGILDAATAGELGLKISTMRDGTVFYSASGASPTQYTIVPSLKLGPSEAKYTQFLIGTFTGWPPHFAGTVGSDLLKNFDLDIDFNAQKVNLFSQDHCEGKVVYWTAFFNSAPLEIDHYGALTVDVILDGQPIRAQIDTGSPHTILNETVSKQIFGIDTTSPGIEKLGGDDGFRYKFKSLAFAGIAMAAPRIFIQPDMVASASRRDLLDSKLQGYQGREPIRSAQLILGTDILRRLHVYIAYKEKKIYLTAADAH